ncbi:MAG: TonB-dependent receptor [Saprospirales bacterium]|nr:TonB-dependent receptor [Saprospirales bacterium]
MWKCLLAAALPFLFFSPAYAQTIPAADSLRLDSLREVVISATRSLGSRFSQPEAVRRLELSGPRVALHRTAPELLLAAPGIWVQKTNHGGGSPFLRGLTGNQTLILIDGIRLNNSTFRYGPNQYLNTVDPFALEALETLHGSGSVQYGSDAMGGVIQLLTISPGFSGRRYSSGRLLTRLATAGMEQTLRAETAWHSPKIAVHGGLSWRHFGNLLGGDTTGMQSPNDYREYALDLKGRFRAGQRLVITAAQQSLVQRHVQVFHKVALENFATNEFEPQERHLSYLRVEWSSAGRHHTILTAYRQASQEGRNSRKNGSAILRHEKDQVETLGLLWQTNSHWQKNWSSQSGIEIYRDGIGSTRTDIHQTNQNETKLRGLYPDGSIYWNYSAFSLQEWKTNRWTLQGGLRWNGFTALADDKDLGSIRFNGAALVGNAGLLRQWNRKTAAFAAVHTAFRAPNIDDMGTLGIVDFRYEIPNYSLEPEQAINSQVGIRLRDRMFEGELFLYRNKLRGLIARIRVDTQTIQGYPVYQKENTGEAYIQGVETNWLAHFGQRWLLDIGGSWQFGRDLTRREPLRRIPPLNGRIQLAYRTGRWSLAIESLGAQAQNRLAQGDKDDNRIPPGGTPGWWIANLHAGFQYRQMNLNLSFQNIFNRDYRYHGSGVNGYGRSCWLHAEWRLGTKA